MKTQILLLSLVAIINFSNVANADVVQNKKLVQDFYDLAFNKHKPREAAEKYLAESYIQHNPHVPTGRQAFIDAFAGEAKTDHSHTTFERVIAEGDLVVLH